MRKRPPHNLLVLQLEFLHFCLFALCRSLLALKVWQHDVFVAAGNNAAACKLDVRVRIAQVGLDDFIKGVWDFEEGLSIKWLVEARECNRFKAALDTLLASLKVPLGDQFGQLLEKRVDGALGSDALSQLSLCT